MKKTTAALRKEDPKKWTQGRVAKALGISRVTVIRWLEPKSHCNNGSKPDARVKILPESKPAIAARVEAGESQAQVAADVGVSQKAISKVVNAERKKTAASPNHL